MKESNATIAGIIFFIIWLGLMLVIADLKSVKPDLSSEELPNNCGGVGHPIDCW